MSEYHVGVGIAGIYAGTINKKGDMWVNKSDVTDEEIDRAQAVEQAYIDKMVELVAEEFKRPKGEWIDIEYYDYDSEGEEWTCYRPKCPFCNEEPKEYSNYCPNCGAKLKEEDPDY